MRTVDDPILANPELPTEADELAARRAFRVENAVPTVLVVDSCEERVATLRRWFRQQASVRTIFAATTAAAVQIVERERPDVAVIDLLLRGGRGIAAATQVRLLVPDLEIVFLLDDPGAPELHAAFDLGWERVVSVDGLEAWLDRGLLPLCRLSSLRRQAAQAQLDAAALAAGNVVPVPSELPLAVAERRYREAFLRGKLATAGGRREAARLAGVPYTTFCVMLRKLGIRG